MSKFRKKLSRSGSKKYFTRNAGVKAKNGSPKPMRGGIRL